VRKSYARTRRRLRRAWRLPAGPERDAALHDARKAAKRARYAAETAAPALGGDARRLARRLKKLQSVLGDHQDTVIARQLERRLGISAQQAGESAFSYGLFFARDACEARSHQTRARRSWRRTARPRYHSWLRG
jgi:CHAD domain-containing protein